MKDFQKQVGTRIRQLREKKGISQEALAASCNLHRTYVGLIERGQRNLSLTTLETVARGLEIPVLEIFQDLGIPEQATKAKAKQTKSSQPQTPTLSELGAHLETIRQILIDAKLTDSKGYGALYKVNLK